jgi:hypothetical protein
MPRYANETKVGSEVSRAEIERTLIRYGASAFQYGWDGTAATVGFRLKGRVVKFVLTLPDRQSREFTRTPERNLERTTEARDAAYEQAIRQRWRALLLVIKAKLEAVDAGIVSLESEFLAQTMLPTGETIGEWVGPQVDEVYRTGGMPGLLPSATHRALPSGT